MNIALTYFCNQSCPYCFGIDAMSVSRRSSEAREMSIDNLYKIMDFMKRSEITEFNMIGGEPTLHSRFEEVYDTVSDNGFSIMIFSNGVIDKHRVEFLSKKDNLVNILLNIRQPKEYSAKDWRKILYTCSRLNKLVTLSYRVYKMDFDPRFLFDLIDEYRLKRLINWGIACPSLIRNNVYIYLEDHKKVVERMVKFSRESKKRNIRWYADAGFILCAFDNGKLEKLKKNVDFIPNTNCYLAMEVAPDLRIFRCYGTAPKTQPGLKITDFKNLEKAERYFFTKSLPFKRLGGMDECWRCEHIISQRCGGGCIVHILKRLPNYRELPPIF